ncbi:hypothetical protein HMPREF9413_1161 [Paenibacillus sp. HGF7]|nr:hypothetical protein HMPREF9413_1161 [Paenibacillus sp. HGF7]
MSVMRSAAFFDIKQSKIQYTRYVINIVFHSFSCAQICHQKKLDISWA